MIRPCNVGDIQDIYEIINDAAKAYKGVIPDDQWHDPYMSSGYLASEVEDGVVFQGFVDSDNNLLGVMGIQEKCDVFLIRHAYVRTLARRQGIGGQLLQHLCQNVEKPFLIGTWKAASWAISFYAKHGFKDVGPKETARLLKVYWSVPTRQIESSIVLADDRWKNDSYLRAALV